MRKQSSRYTDDDTYFRELEDSITWEPKRKQLVRNKMLESIDKLDRKMKLWRIFKYASSVAAVLFMLFIGYHFLLQQDLLLTDESQHIERTAQPQVQHKPMYELTAGLQYYGTYDEQDRYKTIAMSDSNIMYYIPVSIRDLDDKTEQRLHFSASESIREQLLSEYDLTPALINKPLLEAKLNGEHLELYFNQADLEQIRGSAGTALGYYGISSFAKNYSEQVKVFTAYGDGKPFHHSGEEFSLENLRVNRTAAYFPVATEKGIFLREDAASFTSLEDVLSEFFSIHERPDLDGAVIDLSMISLERIEENQDETIIYLNGDLAQSNRNGHINQESLKLLLAHGVALNVRSNPQLIAHPSDHAKIILNDETLFDGQLSYIRFNVLEGLNLEAEEGAGAKVEVKEEVKVKEEAASFQNQQDFYQEDTIELTEIQEKLQIGLTQPEVEQVLGENWVEVTSAKDRLPMWRYDLNVREGYSSEALVEFGDFVDLEGISNGDVGLQIFIAWSDEQKVQTFSIYYPNHEDGKVYEYRVFPENFTREQIIF